MKIILNVAYPSFLIMSSQTQRKTSQRSSTSGSDTYDGPQGSPAAVPVPAAAPPCCIRLPQCRSGYGRRCRKRVPRRRPLRQVYRAWGCRSRCRSEYGRRCRKRGTGDGAGSVQRRINPVATVDTSKKSFGVTIEMAVKKNGNWVWG